MIKWIFVWCTIIYTQLHRIMGYLCFGKGEGEGEGGGGARDATLGLNHAEYTLILVWRDGHQTVLLHVLY